MSRADDPVPRIEQSWLANADAWTRAVRERRIESRRLATDAAIVQAVLERSPRRVLDVGCGEGWLCRALSERGIEAVGVDGSASLAEAARASGGGSFVHLSYEGLIARPDRLGDEPFDAVVCNFALLQEEIVPLLRSLRARIAPGGALLIQTAHPWSAAGERYEDSWRVEDFAGFEGDFAEPMPWYFRTLGSWGEALREGGYVIERMREPAGPDGSPLSLLLVTLPDGREPAG